ncbi:MAG: sigma-54 dependent transcriptional regulator [Nannocystaceae bacterium]
MSATILVVDDDAAVRFTLQEALGDRGFAVVTAAGAREALTRLDGVAAVVTDYAMPEVDGMALLQQLRERDSSLPVVMLTAHGSERLAVAVLRAGAFDYLVKPFDLDELVVVLERAIEIAALRRSDLQHRVEATLGRAIVGHSPRFRQVLELARRVAPRDVTVLLRGETGTGKELVATLVHCASGRRDGPLVRWNCAAIPDELAESELFGHVRGAFTGAVAPRPGAFRSADGGTLVLDEIGELSPAVQAKLLRVLQQGEVQPVGADRPAPVDVRVIACTHRDLRAEVAAGRFREDLYWRLAVVELELPSLRERADDIPRLVEAFRAHHAARFGLEHVALTPALVAELARRPWPGNVRELENTVARMLALCPGGTLDVDALLRPQAPARTGEALPLRERVAAFERSLVEQAYAESGGNQSEAARRLGLSRVTLIDKLRRHGLLR